MITTTTPAQMRAPALLLILAGIICATTTPGAAAPRPEVLDGPAPEYPSTLMSSDVNQGYAVVLATIDDTGEVLDVWTIEASHPAFAEAGERTLTGWRYAAPRAPATAPWPRVDAVRFAFSRAGQITTHTHAESAAKAFPKPSALSARLETLPRAKTGQLVRLAGASPAPTPGTPSGRASVEFVVDRTGRVRVPMVLAAEHPAHARAVIAAVRTWRFAPPAGEASAVGVRARWRFQLPAVASDGG